MSNFNYFVKSLFIGGVCLSFAACDSKSDNDLTQLYERNHRIVFQPINIANAKYLSIGKTGSSDYSTRGSEDTMLFKVDENGNISAVKLSYTVVDKTTGEIAETRTEISVTPSQIASIHGKYTVLHMCDFLDEYGRSYVYEILQSYEQDGYEVDLLVRNADGKIFYIPNRIFNDFFYDVVYGNEDGMTEMDVNGNVYISSRGVIGKISTDGDQLIIRQVTPENIYAIDRNYVMLPMANGTVIVKSIWSKEEITLYYPTGGFEEVKTYISSPNGQYTSTYIYLSNDGTAIGVEQTGKNDFSVSPTVSLYKYNIGTGYGTCHRGDLIASFTDMYHVYGESLIETDENYIIDKYYAVNKSTREMTEIKGYQDYSAYIGAGYPGVDVANKNKYKNRYWGVNEKGSTWFDPETLEFGKVDFNNISDRIRVTERVCNISTGIYYTYGVDYTDGSNIIYATDIETGRSTVTHMPDNRVVIALAPLN